MGSENRDRHDDAQQDHRRQGPPASPFGNHVLPDDPPDLCGHDGLGVMRLGSGGGARGAERHSEPSEEPCPGRRPTGILRCAQNDDWARNDNLFGAKSQRRKPCRRATPRAGCQERELFLLMGNEAERVPAGPQFQQQAEEPLPARRVEVGKWLVQQQQRRIVDQRASDVQPLPHAAGKPRRQAIGVRREAGRLEPLVGPAPRVLGPAHSAAKARFSRSVRCG